MSIDLLADMGFETEDEVIEKIEQLRTELAAKTAECERLKEHAHDLQSCYNAQCQCTDEWAEKYRNEVERKADATLLAAVEEAQKNQAIVNARLGVVQAERDKLLAERKELEAHEPVAYSIGNTLHWHKGKGVTNSQLYTSPRPVPAVPEGYRLVPEKLPTVTLLDAARYRALRNQDIEKNFPRSGLFIGRIPDNKCLTHEHADIAVDAMLAAAPKEPT